MDLRLQPYSSLRFQSDSDLHRSAKRDLGEADVSVQGQIEAADKLLQAQAEATQLVHNFLPAQPHSNLHPQPNSGLHRGVGKILGKADQCAPGWSQATQLIVPHLLGGTNPGGVDRTTRLQLGATHALALLSPHSVEPCHTEPLTVLALPVAFEAFRPDDLL